MSAAPAVPRHGWPAAAAVGALGVFSATWDLGGADRKLDEGAYAQAGWSVVHGGPDLVAGHPPLAKLLYGGAQLLFGRDDLAGLRSVAAVGFLASAAVLFAFGRRLGGWWTGVAAAGLFVVLPRSMVVAGWTVSDLRIERHALLESVAAPLVLGALWAGWRWCVGDGSRWALAAGALGGLAACTKLSAAAVLVPVVLVGGALRWGRPKLATDLGWVVGSAVVAFLLPFLVFGTAALRHVGTVLRFPGERSEQGHRLVLAGDVWDRSPWWANLRYQWDADGPILVAALAVGLLLALVCRRRPAVAYLVVAVGALLGPAMASPVALPHYRALWTGPVLLLVAVAVVDAIGRPERTPWVVATRAAAVASMAVLALVGALAVVQQATTVGGDYRALARQVHAAGVAPTKVLVYAESVAPSFDGAYDSLAPFDDGSVPAQLVVLDPSLAEAVDPDVVERWRGWARAWGLAPHRVGRLEAWWAEP